jgi:hypothetical protein
MKQDLIVNGFGAEPGDFVSVRPCADEHKDKTFLGIYVGDVRVRAGFLGHNPCMWVPELKEFIFGFESWWGKIESPEQLREITDADIESQPYVRALRAFVVEGQCPEGESNG